jgi:hypothetical protein
MKPKDECVVDAFILEIRIPFLRTQTHQNSADPE